MKPSQKTPRLHCITRIDIDDAPRGGDTHGWEVRVRRRNLPTHEFFSDRKHGGKDKALAAAMKLRDELVAHFPTIPRAERAQQLMRNNTSGIPGVYRRVKQAKRRGRAYKYEFWTATGSPEPGVRKVRDFSIARLGEENAKDAAVKQRGEWLRQMAEHDAASSASPRRAVPTPPTPTPPTPTPPTPTPTPDEPKPKARKAAPGATASEKMKRARRTKKAGTA